MSASINNSARWSDDGPLGLANRMASYIRDPRYIHGYVAREYGGHRAPPLDVIERLRADHERRAAPKTCYEQRRLDEIEARKKARAEAAAEREAAKERKRQQRVEASAHELTAPGFPPTSQATRIINAVAFAYAMAPATLVSKGRRKAHVAARAVAIRLLRDLRKPDNTFKYSTPQIAKIVGHTDHSTVVHSLATFDKRRQHDPRLAAVYDRLKAHLDAR